MAGKNVVLFAFADEAGATLSRQIDALRRNGLDGLEIRGVNGRNVCDLTETEAGEIRRRMDDAGLSVWSIGSPIGKTIPGEDDFAAECDHLRRSLVLADILGAKRIRVFSFYIPAGQQPEELRGEIIDRLGHFCDISQRSGVRLCHENEKVFTVIQLRAAATCWMRCRHSRPCSIRRISCNAGRMFARRGCCCATGSITYTSRTHGGTEQSSRPARAQAAWLRSRQTILPAADAPSRSNRTCMASVG